MEWVLSEEQNVPWNGIKMNEGEAEALLVITASIASFFILIKSSDTIIKPLESTGAPVLRG